ncbi:hypothetical protein ABH920_003378 [Catenulispora sp. EB89]|uniref:oxygenase MpaB family protein n=1 Tax=Catenulispora sp. EB89 TaxID=3156257 RepID=UPI003514DCE6
MKNLSRRRALSLGGAVGLASVALDVPKAWSWSSAGSIAGTDTVTDPFSVWDPVPDQVAAQILADGATASVNSAWQAWIRNSAPLPSGMPGYLTSYLQGVNQLPSWADTAKLAAAGQAYQQWMPYMEVAIVFGSGILSTVIPREARAVYYSAGGANMKARAAKTFTLAFDMMAADSWAPTGHAIVSANKTRLVHSTVRNLLPTSAKFEATADEPKPISNGDILRTFHSVGTANHLTMAKWGVSMSADQQAADLHAWQVALHMLGVQDQFIPASWADAVAQAQQMLWPNLVATQEGVSLAQTLLGYIEQPTFGLDTGFVNEFVRYTLGDTYADWLGLGHDLISRGVIEVGWPAFVAFSQGLTWIAPGSYGLIDAFVQGVSNLFLSNATSVNNTPITLPSANRPGA